jgi:ABC-type molybdate transport system ATPase subunit
VLHGPVRGGLLELRGLQLAVPGPDSARATFALAAEDILLSTHPLDGISARNVLPARLLALDSRTDAVLARAELTAGLEWRVKLTPAAVAALNLAAGQAIYLVVKTHSLRRLRA